ncbi:alpha/beta hydrolase-fold protein [Kocuria salsicia]|uniref:Alpha/beta hydrolase-fold protein n=1 Tax=Kocuria salsicia TaxID=664639 RepID=A0ABV3KC85_9MICC
MSNDSRDVARARREVEAALAAGMPLCEHAAPGPDGAARQVVMFLCEDSEASEVLLFVNRLTDESRPEDSLMRRLPGTDVWHIGYLMGTSWRASYCFLTARRNAAAPWRDAADHVDLRAALDGGVADPRNPSWCLGRGGLRLSVVALEDAPVSPWPVRPDPTARGPKWLAAPGGHRVAIAACGVAAGDSARTAPVVLLFDGEVWWQHGVVAAVRAAVADGALQPVHLVLLDSGGTERRWAELDGTGGIEDVVADELLPWLAQRVVWKSDPRRVAVVGQSLGGLSAILCALRRPDAVGTAVAQSASLWQPQPVDTLRSLVSTDGARALVGTRLVLEVGEQEWALTGPHDEFVAELARTPAEVHYRRFNGGHDYACWREALVPALVELFPGGRPVGDPHGSAVE